jgi:hypothetical protein
LKLLRSWSASRRPGTARARATELTRDLQRAHVNEGKGVFDQDHVVLEAQQRAIDRNPRSPFYNLSIDAGALWASSLIDQMLGPFWARQLGKPGRPPFACSRSSLQASSSPPRLEAISTSRR